MAFPPGPINPELNPWSVLNPNYASRPVFDPGAYRLPSLPLPATDQTSPAFPISPVLSTSPTPQPGGRVFGEGVTRGSGREELEKNLERLRQKQLWTKSLTMSPEDFSGFTEALMKTPAFAQQLEGIKQQENMAMMAAKYLPARPDISAGAMLFGLPAEPFKGSAGGLPMLMETGAGLQKARQDLVKEALGAVKALQIGKYSSETGMDTLAELVRKITDPSMRRGPVNPEGKAPIGDFQKRYESSPVMKGYYDRMRTSDLADTLLSTGDANSMDQLKYIAAKHFDSGGRLSDQDFERAGGGSKALEDQLRRLYYAWKDNKALPRDVEYMRMLIDTMRNSDERQADEYARLVSKNAPRFFRGTNSPEELFYSIRPTGNWSVTEREKQKQAAAQKKEKVEKNNVRDIFRQMMEKM